MKKQVEIGQLYQSVGKPSLTWEVAKIVDQSGIPHARLMSLDGRDQRLVACSVIIDSSRYRLTRESGRAHDNAAE
jgi:hypothetical protein